ncbi:hypothetical protein ACODJC_12500 [Vagococcus fluvialis]|uniref:hypothetical protein n=1 Tax=Vagococcus fluvialis TaxID=2738 RepID=UPI003B5D05BD
MEKIIEFLPKEVSNLSEYIQEVQKLDTLQQLYDYYNCNDHINDDFKSLLKETDLSKLKTNSDEIYLRINFIEKLLLINKIVNRNKIETAFKPIDKLTPIKKDIKQINAILESDYSFKKKYIEISKKNR